MKLELKHIQHYPIGGEDAIEIIQLGDEPEILRINGVIDIDGELVICTNGSEYDYNSDMKLLLRPMSDLYREIDGKIGIVELAKIAFPDFDFSLDRGRAVYGKFELSYNIYRHYFACSSLGELRIVPNQLDLFNYLFENHYDVYDLIGQGLAIDKNTIQN